MDFRQTKTVLALGILSIGMAIALVWHGWQGWVLHRGYPYNTCLFTSRERFSDLTQVIANARSSSPYRAKASYFPATYVVFRGLGSWHSATAVFLFLTLSGLGIWVALTVAFQNLWGAPYSLLKRILLATAFMALSYPVIYAADRANIELGMALLVGIALLCFSRRGYTLGLAFLLPAICFKLYAGLLLVLFVRPKHLWRVCMTGGAFAAITFVSLLSFSDTIRTSLSFWHQNLASCQTGYLIKSAGLSGSVSPWSTCRVFLITWQYLTMGSPSGIVVLLNEESSQHLYNLYALLAGVIVVLVILYVIFMETVFFRRAMVLLLMMTMIVPLGGEYRMLYVNMALIVLLNLNERRKYDFIVVALLAFAIIPKREIYFPYLGVTDSGAFDVSLGVFLNVPCLLVAVVLLMRGGWPDRPWAFFRVRFGRYFNAISRFSLNQGRLAAS